ncbi:hypothetical protein [Mariprofundus ferrooxydans]|uniref:hypothetical protein n=1 Tax=Mariprofundus ferrooxydans TaxID=314344 RepID=UPI00036EED41|nr:hypothetical protein [Mariprofundus ferrooxydans]
MSVTLGFVMRFDSYPPAVAVPPLISPQQVVTQFTNPVIDITPVSRSSEAAGGGAGLRNELRSSAAYQDSAKEPPLTYTHRGQNASSALATGGRAIDLFV